MKLIGGFNIIFLCFNKFEVGEKLENNERMVGQIRKNLADKARFDESLVMSK